MQKQIIHLAKLLLIFSLLSQTDDAKFLTLIFAHFGEDIMLTVIFVSYSETIWGHKEKILLNRFRKSNGIVNDFIRHCLESRSKTK